MRKLSVLALHALFLCCVFVLLGGTAQGAARSVDEEILLILRHKNVITSEEYRSLMNKIERGDQSVSEDILDLLKRKDVISGQEHEKLKEKAVAEAKRETEDATRKVAKTLGFDVPGWVSRIHPHGDLRLRHDTQWVTDADDERTTRNRERFRLRLGVKADITETTEVGVRLGSGSGFQNTLNQSFDGQGRGKQIFIDRVYAQWKPSKSVRLVAGKHKNHLLTTPLVWDPDVSPEGVAEAVSFDVNDRVSGFANLGQWFVEELKGADDDPTLLAFQVGTVLKPSKKAKLELAGTYYNFINADQYDSGGLGDDEEFVGYNASHSQQMVFDSEGNLLNEFEVLEANVKLSMKDVLPVPVSFFGTYLMNTAADIGDLIAKGVDTGGDDPADLMAYRGDDRGQGWLVGFGFGNKKKRGDWHVGYHYQKLEDYAFPAVFVDSDFHGGGTNNQGHRIKARYFLTDSIYAAATGYLTEREDEKKDGKKDRDRIQLDVVLKF